MEIERDGNIEIDYEIENNILRISHLYVDKTKRKNGLASSRIEEIIREADTRIETIQISIRANESSRGFLESEGFTITHFNPGGLVEAHKKL